MIYNKQEISSEPRFCKGKLNFKIDSNTIPNLVPKKKLDVLFSADENPYFIIEEIEDIRQPANGIYYSVEFWESYLAKLKKRPIPGSKNGHNADYYRTPDNDIYTIGGKIENNKIFLKVYIPPEGAISNNKGFIRDVKAGLIHFSIVSWTKDNIETDENGYVKKITAVESVKGERNDAVEYGLGAMEQKVNKDEKNPDKNINKQEVNYIMAENQYNEIIKNINNQLDNGSVSKKDLAKDLGIEIVTDEHKNAIQKMNEIIKITGDDPVKRINELLKNEETVKKQAYDNEREKLLAKAFGPEKTKQNGEEIDNLKRQAAEPLVKKECQSTEDLQKEISAAKENPVVKKFSFEEADVNSDVNDITGVKIVKNKDDKKSDVVYV